MMAMFKLVCVYAVSAFTFTHGATWSKRASKFAQAESMAIEAAVPERPFDSDREAIRSTVLLQASALSKKVKVRLWM